jgi:hypothetical protein
MCLEFIGLVVSVTRNICHPQKCPILSTYALARTTPILCCVCVLNNGNVMAFGDDYSDYGALGLGEGVIETSTPTLISGLSNVRSCSISGSGSSICVRNDGTVLGFGDHTHGQLGLGDSPGNSASAYFNSGQERLPGALRVKHCTWPLSACPHCHPWPH